MDELLGTDLEARKFLDDIESFRRPPPVKKLTDTGDISTDLSPGSKDAAGGSDFVATLRKFQLSDSHPYAGHDRIEASKKLATGGGPTGMLSLAADVNRRQRIITKEESANLREMVCKLSRPVNPYSSSSSRTVSSKSPSLSSSGSPTASSASPVSVSNHHGSLPVKSNHNTTYDGHQTLMADKEVSRIFSSVDQSRSPSENGRFKKSVAVSPTLCKYSTEGVRDHVQSTSYGPLTASRQETPTWSKTSTGKISNELGIGKMSPLCGLDALNNQRLKYLQLEQEVEKELKQNDIVYGTCKQCNEPVARSMDLTHALGFLYHSECFCCCVCGRLLKEKKFYQTRGRIYCEEDYFHSGFQQMAEKCHSCGQLILEMILQAAGKSFHPLCFRCEHCQTCLDGVPFTIDNEGRFYCVEDYHMLFAPKCAKCGHPIIPDGNAKETVRVVALEQDYHVDCYVCEGCGEQLTDEPDRRCYPLDGHLLCRRCHFYWTQTGGTANPITDLMNRADHVQYLLSHLHELPDIYLDQYSNRLTLLYFVLSGLDILDAMDSISADEKRKIIDWIYSLQVPVKQAASSDDCGFLPAHVNMRDPSGNEDLPELNTGHLVMTYFAILCLGILGDNFERLDFNLIKKFVKGCQMESGCFRSDKIGGEQDMRFLFCGVAICKLLNDFSYIDVSKATSYIKQCRNYDGAFGSVVGCESHGGSTFCAVASLYLLDKLFDENTIENKSLQKLTHWIIHRQNVGFHGRPHKDDDSCYSFWVGAVVEILQAKNFIDCKRACDFTLSTQDDDGGFGKTGEAHADLMHTYLSLAGLSILGYPGLKPLNAALNATLTTLNHIENAVKNKASQEKNA
ncbi:LIM domain-containing protein jub [Trichinella patagoniensis]|uniref:LIM domain-containing protein jub n=1 Tax=Trichinella patagoniensis TaxID=990121 RepID=A0A0V0ZSR2_9BILA|nr:LIM domain-containing protein jub [Trichinella patagoniensis]